MVRAKSEREPKEAVPAPNGRGGQRALLLFLRSNKKLLVGSVLLLLIAAVAVFAPLIAPYGYDDMGAGGLFEPPSMSHLLGTDNYGRDVFSRIVCGTRISLGVSLLCVGIALLLGVPLGLLSGYLGGWVDMVVMRLCDMILAIPWVLLAVSITAILGPGLDVVVLAVGVVFTPGVMRLARSMALSIREKEYVDAARVLGESRLHILTRYVFPNALAPLIVRATMLLASGVLYEAGISYLGYGAQPPTSSWGLMLTSSQVYMWQSPLLAVFPGAAIVLLVLAMNTFGDGLRDLLDPKYKGKVV